MIINSNKIKIKTVKTFQIKINLIMPIKQNNCFNFISKNIL